MSPSAHSPPGQPRYGSSTRPPSRSPVLDCSEAAERPAWMRTDPAHERPAQSGRTAVTGGAPLVLRQGAYSSSRPDDPREVSCGPPHAQARRAAVIPCPPNKTGDTAPSLQALPRLGSSLAGAVVAILPALVLA